MAEVLSDRQVAQRYRLPLEWVKSQAKAGVIPHLRIGRRFLFNSIAVAETLARLAAQSHQEVARG
jgi:hypothetical protein